MNTLDKIKAGGIVAAVIALLYFAKRFVVDPGGAFVEETATEWYFSDKYNEQAVQRLTNRGYAAPAWIARTDAALATGFTSNLSALLSNANNAAQNIRVSELAFPPAWESPPLWLEAVRGKRLFESVTLTEARDWLTDQYNAVQDYYRSKGML